MIPSGAHLRYLIRLGLLTAAGCVVVVLASAVYVVHYFDSTAEFPVDCAVVFGAAVHRNNKAGPGITRRTKTASDLYVAGDVNRLILTGGKGDEFKDSEALVMQRVAMRYGVDIDDITLEPQSVSTWQNLALSKRFVEDCSSIVAISDRYHLARIRLLASRLGWGRIATHPADIIPPWMFEARAVLRESFAVLYYAAVTLL